MINKKRYFNVLLTLIVTILISSCGGGVCLPTPINESFDFLVSAPSEYPAGVAVTVPVVVKNTGNHIDSNISYQITNNTSGAAITITKQSLASCLTLESQQSCSLAIQVPASSKPGSFSIVATSTGNKFEQASIGLTERPVNNEVGVNGLTAYNNEVTSLPNNNAGIAIVTFVVTSANAGSFNTIDLVDASGNQLQYQVLTGNSGAGLTVLSQGSVISLAVNIPSGATQLSFYPTLKLNGTTIANGNAATPTTITVLRPANKAQGALNVVPSNFALNESNPTQIITISNTGNAIASNISPIINSPMTIDISASTCGSTLAAGKTCTYTIKFDAAHSDKAGTSSFTVNYNNGTTTSSDTSTFTYQGKLAVANLTIASGDNPNFNFYTTTANPSAASIVTITNSGSVALESFNYTLPNYFSASTATIANACTTNLILKPNESCNIALIYNNSSVTPASTSQVTVNYKYINLIDKTTVMSGSSSIAVTSQTTQSEAILSANPAPINFGNVLNNNYQYESQVITITNNGDIATANTPAISLATLDSFYTIESNTCNAPLNPQATCTITVNVGPIDSTIAAGTVTNALNITYQPYPSSAVTNPLAVNMNVQVVTAQTAIINVTQTESSGFVAGNGTPRAQFYLESDVTGSVTYTITNTGAVPANNFNLIYSTGALLPWVATGSCTTMPTLAANGGSCTVTFTSRPTNSTNLSDIPMPPPGPSSNRNTGGTTRNLPVNIITMNWIDQDSPTGQNQAFAISPVYVNIFNTPVINGSASFFGSSTDVTISSGNSAIVSFNLVGGYNIGNQTITLQSVNDTISYSGSCTVSSTSSNCMITIFTLTTTPDGTYNIPVTNAGSVVLAPTSFNVSVVSGGEAS